MSSTRSYQESHADSAAVNERTHSHLHHHHHHAPQKGKNLLFVTLLNAVITLVEIIGGLVSNSLSLLSDAIHNLGDTLSIILAFGAQKMAARKADLRHTFGYKRAEILAAFINASTLVAICLFLFKEAYDRWIHPEPLKGRLMLIVAIVGLLGNLLSVVLLRDEKQDNINTHAAYLHLLGDTLSSVAVILGGFAIWKYEIYWLDPLITVLVSCMILYHTFGVLHEAIDILMQTAPHGIDIEGIVQKIEAIEDVTDVHHLHVWQLNEQHIHFEAHINVSEKVDMERLNAIRETIKTILHGYDIDHVTLQIAHNCCAGDVPLIVNDYKDKKVAKYGSSK